MCLLIMEQTKTTAHSPPDARGTVPFHGRAKLILDRAVGVSKMGQKFACFVTIAGKSCYIGSFNTHDDAAWAFDSVVRLLGIPRPTNFDPNLMVPAEIFDMAFAKRK